MSLQGSDTSPRRAQPRRAPVRSAKIERAAVAKNREQTVPAEPERVLQGEVTGPGTTTGAVAETTVAGTTVATVDSGGLPAELLDMAAEDAGKGISTSASDNIVPNIRILQPLSDEVDDTNPAYIEGARPGWILLPNSPIGAIPGEVGIRFQHCFFYKAFPEWIPRGQGGGGGRGFKGRHECRIATAEDVQRFRGKIKIGDDIPDVDDDVEVTITPKGMAKWSRPLARTELVHTRYHAGFVVAGSLIMPYVIPLASTGHTVSKNWMYAMNNRFLPNGRGREPAWLRLNHLTTRKHQNSDGTWWQFDVVAVPGTVDVEGYRRGRDLNAAFTAGEKTIDAEASDPVDVSPGRASDVDVPY